MLSLSTQVEAGMAPPSPAPGPTAGSPRLQSAVPAGVHATGGRRGAVTLTKAVISQAAASVGMVVRPLSCVCEGGGGILS